MFAQIQEISTLSGTPMTYVLIHIWPTKTSYDKGDKPSGDNAFVMDLYTTDQRKVVDRDGRHKKLDGTFTHPSNATADDLWEMETYQVDVPSEIQRNIKEYLARRKLAEGTDHAFPRFHATPALARTKDDPRGILIKSSVTNLVGKGIVVR